MTAIYVAHHFIKLEIDNDNSLVELISRDVTFDECLVPIDFLGTDFYFIPGKSVAANSLNVLSSSYFKELIENARSVFDLIIIDCPPTLAVSDAKIIAQVADKMLYAVKWDDTPKPLVKTGIKTALAANMDLAGIVLTQVNLRKHARYGYGDYGNYYGTYGNYYST